LLKAFNFSQVHEVMLVRAKVVSHYDTLPFPA